MGVSSLPKTVTRQRRDCDLNPAPKIIVTPLPWADTSLPQTASRSVQSFCAAHPCALLTGATETRGTRPLQLWRSLGPVVFGALQLLQLAAILIAGTVGSLGLQCFPRPPC